LLTLTTTTMNAPASPSSNCTLELPDLDWITDEGRVARLSQDFSWFSPVLKRQLKDKRADAVVRPRSEDEIALWWAPARAAARADHHPRQRHRQLRPDHAAAGGVVLDMSGYNAFLWVQPGVARAQAGIRLGELEKQTKSPGQEMRCMPSTYRSATLGGLFGGGFGGVGSINYGPLGSPGNVLGIAR
jgi:FAD/FMN-containing dehydrogenase